MHTDKLLFLYHCFEAGYSFVPSLLEIAVQGCKKKYIKFKYSSKVYNFKMPKTEGLPKSCQLKDQEENTPVYYNATGILLAKE